VWGPVKDTIAKTHPQMIVFEKLPLEQQVRNRLFRAIVHAISPVFILCERQTKETARMIITQQLEHLCDKSGSIRGMRMLGDVFSGVAKQNVTWRIVLFGDYAKALRVDFCPYCGDQLPSHVVCHVLTNVAVATQDITQ